MTTRRKLVLGALAGALGPLLRTRSALGEAAAASGPGGLGTIRAVTLTAPDLEAVLAAWTRFMGYRLVSRGRIAPATAASWDAPALTGKPYLVLGPESGEQTCLRFVQQGTADDDPAAGSLGWRTTEITVQNADQLYERLKDSPFTVTRPPAGIPTYSYLRAMHAMGPAGEQLNLTWITEPRPDLAAAKSFVGRCFIAVLGAPDLPAALEFYRSVFGNVPSPIRQLPSLQLAVVPLADGAKIEIDHLPNAPPRARPIGGLPPGIALVSFDCARFEQMQPRFIARPARNAIEPFRGRRAGTLRGPAGELIELLEA